MYIEQFQFFINFMIYVYYNNFNILDNKFDQLNDYNELYNK